MSHWLFGSKKQRSNTPQTPAASSFRVQSSVAGKPIPIMWGRSRLAGNLIWYGDFQAITNSGSSVPVHQGKGSLFGGTKGGSNPATQTITYTYRVSVIIAICHGAIADYEGAWADKAFDSVLDYGFNGFHGSSTDGPWDYLVSLHPDQALAYRRLAYLAAGPFDLGSAQSLPNFTFDIKGPLNGFIGTNDASPAGIVTDFLTNPDYGAGFPADMLGDLSDYEAYCGAVGLGMSPVLTDQAPAQDFLKTLIESSNSEGVFSQGKLLLVPYGDRQEAANGYVWNPPAQALYDLTDDDFIPGGGGGAGGGPIGVQRTSPATVMNQVSVEFLDRTIAYNPSVAKVEDDAGIQDNGPRPLDTKSWHHYTTAAAAMNAAALILGRQQVRNLYTLAIGAWAILLEPMDLVTLTEATLGLSRQPVRIKEIKENADKTLTLTCEDYLAGTASAPRYGTQAPSGYLPNYNADPGGVVTPIIFEPPDALAQGLAVWVAIAGLDLANWGGADVYVSTDGVTYSHVKRLLGSNRIGVLSGPLAAIAANTTGGLTIDQTNFLNLNLAESGGVLTSVSQAAANAGNSLCYVDGELLAYQNAQLGGASAYSLSYLVRGLYGSAIGAHGAGANFAFLDEGVSHIPFTQDRVGTTLYLKFVSFNIFGGGKQSLANVPAYTYTITGSALASALPSLTNVRAAYVDGVTNLVWDELVDFRPVRYEIRKGDTWLAALSLGNVAHPPFAVFGDGSYWIAGVTTPLPGLTIYSAPSEVIVTGSLLTQNIIAQWDEQATGWTGTFTGGAGIQGPNITTGGAGNILADPDVLNTPDIVNYGGSQSGAYEIPRAHWIEIGYVTACPVKVTWIGVGVPVGQDILSIPDILSTPDILGSASSRFVDVYPDIALATAAATTNLYVSGDLYTGQDLYTPMYNWSPWQKYAPGAYVGRAFKFRMNLFTFDAKTNAECLAMKILVNVPTRSDHITNLALAAGGTAVTWQPDGAASPAPFNGGPNASPTQPNVSASIRNAAAGDDLLITSVSLTGATFQVKNAGVGVARSIDAVVQGY